MINSKFSGGWLQPVVVQKDALRKAIRSDRFELDDDELNHLAEKIMSLSKLQQMFDNDKENCPTFADRYKQLKRLRSCLEKANTIISEFGYQTEDLLESHYSRNQENLLDSGGGSDYGSYEYTIRKLIAGIDSLMDEMKPYRVDPGRRRETRYAFLIIQMADYFEQKLKDKAKPSKRDETTFYRTIQFILDQVLKSGIKDPSRHISTALELREQAG